MLWRLRELREAADMTQAEVAQRLGTTPVSVGRYEREPWRVDLVLMERLAKVLNVPPLALLSAGTDEEHRFSMALHLRGSDKHMMFDRALISSLGDARNLAAVEIGDDAMEPTLPVGGVVIVDMSQRTIERDGLYLMEVAGHEVVRRVFVQMNGSLRVAGDHHMYRDGITVRPDELTISGRVVWGGRRF